MLLAFIITLCHFISIFNILVALFGKPTSITLAASNFLLSIIFHQEKSSFYMESAIGFEFYQALLFRNFDNLQPPHNHTCKGEHFRTGYEQGLLILLKHTLGIYLKPNEKFIHLLLSTNPFYQFS